MTDTNLQAFALAQGIKKKTSAMSQEEKVMLRYNYVLSVTKNAQGDFIRTGDAYANQTRIMGETVKEIGTVFGSDLLPKVTDVIKKINELLVKVAEFTPEQRKMALEVAGFAIATGPALLGIGKLAGAVSPLNNLIGKSSTFFTNMKTNSLQAAASLGNKLSSNITKVNTSINNFLSKDTKLSNFITSSIDKMGTGVGKIAEPFKKMTVAVEQPIANFLTKVKMPFSNMTLAEDWEKNVTPLFAKFQTFIGKVGIIGQKGMGQLAQIAQLALKMVAPAAVIGLLLAGLGVAQEKFGVQIDGFLNIAITKGPAILEGLITGIVSKLPQLIDLGVNLLLKLVDTIIANLPIIIQRSSSNYYSFSIRCR